MPYIIHIGINRFHIGRSSENVCQEKVNLKFLAYFFLDHRVYYQTYENTCLRPGRKYAELGHTFRRKCGKLACNRKRLGRTGQVHNHWTYDTVLRVEFYLINTNRFALFRHVYSWCSEPRSYGMLPLLGLLFCYPLESGECQSWCESNSPMKVFSLYIISMMRYYKMVFMLNLYLVRFGDIGYIRGRRSQPSPATLQLPPS